MSAIRSIFIGAILFSLCINLANCKKDKKPDPPPPPPTDSLGTGWQKIKIPGTNFLSDIFFITDKKGFVCGSSYLGRSTDGGLTWTQIAIPIGIGDLSNIFFLNSTQGWVIGTTAILRTTDGGDTWTKEGNFSKATDIQFLNPRLGYLTNGGGLMKSIDSGKTWTSTAASGTGELSSLYFIDSLHGWVTSNGKVSKTVNAGNDFTIQTSYAGSPYIVQFVDATHGWTAGGGGILGTIDGGTQWGLIMQTTNLGDVHFFNADRGFLMDDQHIYKTINGGATFVQVAKLGTIQIVEIHFIDEQHGWACGTDGYILRFVQ